MPKSPDTGFQPLGIEVSRTTADVPVQPGLRGVNPPDIHPHDPNKLTRRAFLLATAGLASAVGIAALTGKLPSFGGSAPAIPTGEPTGTPKPENTATSSAKSSNEPSATASGSPDFSPTPSPTPEQTPDNRPDWVKLIPPSPYKSISEVPHRKGFGGFNSYGDLIMLAGSSGAPHYDVQAHNVQILKVIPDIEKKQIRILVTTGATKMTRMPVPGQQNVTANGYYAGNMYDYSGGAFYVTVSDGAYSGTDSSIFGNKLSDFTPYLKVGDAIKFTFFVGTDKVNKQVSKAEAAANLSNWNKYKGHSIGATVPEKEPIAEFIADSVTVYTNQ